jgi:hypothetical protein
MHIQRSLKVMSPEETGRTEKSPKMRKNVRFVREGGERQEAEHDYQKDESPQNISGTFTRRNDGHVLCPPASAQEMHI